MWGPLLAVLLAAELPAPASDPPPDEAPRVGLVAGTATAVVPLIVGGALMANDKSPSREEAGVYVMTAGFALAPWVAHGLEGSWRRAAVYGGVSLLLSAGAVISMDEADAFNPHVGNRERIPMKIFLPAAMGSAMFGVIMSTFDHGGLRPVPQLSFWMAPVDGSLASGIAWSAPL
jgi:hypothetical protein